MPFPQELHAPAAWNVITSQRHLQSELRSGEPAGPALLLSPGELQLQTVFLPRLNTSPSSVGTRFTECFNAGVDERMNSRVNDGAIE